MFDPVGIARAIHVAATLSMFGAFLFRATVAPNVFARADPAAVKRIERQFGRLAFGSLALAFIVAAPWLLLLAGNMSGATGLTDAMGAVSVVLRDTQFGHLFILRMGLLLGVGICMCAGRSKTRKWLPLIEAGLVGVSLILHAGSGHASAAGGGGWFKIIVAVLALHLIAAGAWLGSLVPLWLTLGLPMSASTIAVKRFSLLGIGSVAVLSATALYNGVIWVGSFAALVRTPYGFWVLLKLVLFGCMLGAAIVNRFYLTPRLVGPDSATSARALRHSLIFETCIGIVVVVAAGMLASTAPAVHP